VLNGFIRDRLVAAGNVDDSRAVATNAGERLGVGDRVATRRNDRDLGVSNRDTWTITAVRADGSLTLRGRRATDRCTLPAGYSREHVELAYATTVYGAQGETTSTGHLMLGEHTSAASAYVAMTRGREDNIAHLVAEDEADARRQWEQVFARDRADLGPAAAAQQAAEDIESYGTQPPTRPLEEVLGDLRTAWTREADLHERHQRLVAQRDALRHVAAIHARYAPQRDRLRDDETTARRSWLQARERVDDLDAALQVETADLRARVRNAWCQELPQAQRAADIVREGTGRLGQHRRQVRDAENYLTAFAEGWRPLVPELRTEPAELATEVGCLHGRRIEDEIDAFVAHQVAAAYPDADLTRQTEHQSKIAYERAERSRVQLDNAVHAELRGYGRAAHVRDPGNCLTEIAAALADVDRDLRTATSGVRALANEPSIRALPNGGLESERDRWAADRGARQQAAAREAKERWQRQQRESRRIEPTPPSRSTPDRGWGIGR
jgi:exodeoxyribonuclease V alpha subunit